MKYLSLDIFRDFECIGSDCPNTCCAGWTVVVDEHSLESYRKVSGSFGLKLEKNILSEDGFSYMNMPKDRCAFLTDQNLCEIYMELGKDKMCETCQIYPRFYNTYGDITFRGLSLSCPEVARKIFEHKEPIQFDFSENKEPVSAESAKTDWSLFNTLISGLTTSIEIVQNRMLTMTERLQLLILFNDALQQRLDAGEDCASVFDAFMPERLSEYLDVIHAIPENPQTKVMFLSNFFRHIGSMQDAYQLKSLIDSVVLCQDLVQVKMRNFSPF